MTEARSVRAALAAVAACTASALLYAFLRVVQKSLLTEPDPALVIWSEHAGFFWRAWIACYTGGMIGFVAYVAAGRDAARTARVLSRSLIAATLAIAAQGLLVP